MVLAGNSYYLHLVLAISNPVTTKSLGYCYKWLLCMTGESPEPLCPVWRIFSFYLKLFPPLYWHCHSDLLNYALSNRYLKEWFKKEENVTYNFYPPHFQWQLSAHWCVPPLCRPLSAGSPLWSCPLPRWCPWCCPPPWRAPQLWGSHSPSSS